MRSTLGHLSDDGFEVGDFGLALLQFRSHQMVGVLLGEISNVAAVFLLSELVGGNVGCVDAVFEF